MFYFHADFCFDFDFDLHFRDRDLIRENVSYRGEDR